MENKLGFLKLLGNLKKIPRTGWLLRGIPNPETVASHSFRVVLIAQMIADEMDNIDFGKVMRMAILHEIGETKLGDVPTPVGEYFDKTNTEKRIADDIINKFQLPKYKSVIDGYFSENSLEKRVVDVADKIDMVLQSIEYYNYGYTGVKDFFKKIDKLIDKYSDIVPAKKILEEIKNESEKL